MNQTKYETIISDLPSLQAESFGTLVSKLQSYLDIDDAQLAAALNKTIRKDRQGDNKLKANPGFNFKPGISNATTPSADDTIHIQDLIDGMVLPTPLILSVFRKCVDERPEFNLNGDITVRQRNRIIKESVIQALSRSETHHLRLPRTGTTHSEIEEDTDSFMDAQERYSSESSRRAMELIVANEGLLRSHDPLDQIEASLIRIAAVTMRHNKSLPAFEDTELRHTAVERLVKMKNKDVEKYLRSHFKGIFKEPGKDDSEQQAGALLPMMQYDVSERINQETARITTFKEIAGLTGRVGGILR